MEKQITQLQELLDNRVLANEPLSKYTTFKIGGPAKYFFVAENNEDLVRAVTYAKRFKIPFYLLGGGSNVLVSDDGYNGLVVLLKSNDIIIKDTKVVCDSGVNLMTLVNKTIEAGLSGLEWAAGIPGTVGGAIRGNAGAYGGQMSDNLVGVEIMRGSKQFILNKEQIKFGYRDSLFKHNSDVIITAEFKLALGKEALGVEQINKILKERKEKQPLEFPSAGCIFKNIPLEKIDDLKLFVLKNDPPKIYLERGKIPAAWLIEQLDLKGKKIGGAQVSDKHANFIVNIGKATASDVIQLISLIKTKVRDTFSLQLEEEIIYVGF